MSELKISDGAKGVKDPAAKLPETVGFAPRGGLRLDGQGGIRRDGQGGITDEAGGMADEVGRD